MAGPAASFDPITLEVLWTRIISVVDEAAKAIVRTSFSTLSNEANDFACVLTDARGNALAQNSGSIPSFIGTLPATVRHFLREIGPERMRPGDVLITNDPWQGTGHMSDVSLVKPIFHTKDGIVRLVAFSSTTSHMPDIGGRIRAIEARELFEEGLHIPLTWLRRGDQADETLLRLIRANVRTPDQTVGDIWAQVSANELMDARVRRLLDDYGLDGLDALGDELFGRAENAMRAAIRGVPDGTYRYALDTDGFEKPYRFKLALTVKGDEVVADFTGTSPAQPRAINCVLAYTYAMTAYAVRCALLPGLPNNEGMYRPVKVVAPEGCLPQPEVPRRGGEPRADRPLRAGARAGRAPPGDSRSGDGGRGLSPLGGGAVRGTRRRAALHQRALLQRRHGRDARQGRRGRALLAQQHLEHAGGGRRAQCAALLPLEAHAVGLGGAGKHRGGLGQDVLFESESKRPIVLSFMAERTRFPAPGLAGGKPGGLGDVRINGKRIDHRRQWVLERGDRVLVSTPGGGGYGAPGARDPAARRRDRALGYVSRSKRGKS
jgi:N-methylhydantoinase B